MWTTAQPTLVAPSVTLRPPGPADVPDLTAACQDPAIDHFTTVPMPYRAADAVWFVEDAATQWSAKTGAHFVVVADGERLVGAISLLGIDPVAGRAELGYWVAPWARGRGVARAAVACLRDWAQQVVGLRRIELRIEDSNLPSRAVAAATGFCAAGEAVDWELKGSTRRLRTYIHGGRD